MFPELVEGRGNGFSLGRLDVRCLGPLPLEETFLTLEGEPGRLNLTSCPRPPAGRLSGDCLREDACEGGAGTTGAGIRLPLATPKVLRGYVRYLGAMLAA